ncbi:hypothetical protein IFM89_021779 [Coptis chinensis]|uniref:DUF1990 domain-containing protein n=1 Tax=Coptis chinensis TaxID=261450 RepID=A0A835M6W9_9MAGN|nr:hypothetical protein IFM89_021779 [Coptis chinensis]
MVFLCWKRPSELEQKACIDKCGTFNYDSKYRAATSKSFSSLQTDNSLSKDGFFLNQMRVLLGSGSHTYTNAKSALQSWKHFGLDWTFVDPKTRIETGTKFCVCVKEFLPWMMMPLQVEYVNDIKQDSKKKLNASFQFGSGTLQGHLLSGEERFSIELDENNQVWYEILSFSKPAHLLSIIGYPYVQHRQKYFAQQSADALVKYVTAQKPKL